ISATGNLDGKQLESKDIIAFTTQADIAITNNSGYEKMIIPADSNFIRTALKYVESDKNYLLIVDTANATGFNRLKRFKRETFKKNNNVVFVLSATDPKNYQLLIKHELSESKLANVVGVLPGNSKKDEYVIFSAHYDHLGIGKPDVKGDSIYNGANDDAAGTTAVIMLSKYFSQIKNNERTLIFVAFTAEEVGGFGSQYFSKQLPPDKVVAMFNIEMIGTESKWGTNSAYITGYERSDFGKILQVNLMNSKFHFEPDPYPKQNLFYRSDNATLAALGVPAHTISTSKMEEAPNNEPNYHKQSDEIGTLDMNNMAEIIKAIAISSKTIVSGKDTPGRVVKSQR
nr:M28 family peptidase [Chitinophagaceae bacterium]